MSQRPRTTGRPLQRLAYAVPAAALAVLLTACGGSDDSDGGGDSKADSSADASASASESASASPSDDAADDSGGDSGSDSGGATTSSGATGADFRSLVEEIVQSGEQVENVQSPEDFNKQVDLPEGIAVVQLDPKTRTFCAEDQNKEIAFRFANAQKIVLLDGACKGGKSVSTLVPKGSSDMRVVNGKSFGEPVRQLFLEQFGQ